MNENQLMSECENCEELVPDEELRATVDDVLLCKECWLVLVCGQESLPLGAA